MAQTCIYFAYGSNLMSKRIHLLNPNAVRCGKGVLNDYILSFGGYASFWGGCAANISKKNGFKVWGALWELKNEDLCYLDRQEGVHEKFYVPIFVEIVTSEGAKIQCRTYQQVEKYDDINTIDLPQLRRPSKSYMETIIKGAEETGLPLKYIEFLKSIPTNNSEIVPEFLQST